MALPLIAVGVLGRFLLQRGGMALAKQYAKKNKKRITQALINQAKNANKNKNIKTKNIGGKGGPSKVKTNKNTTPKKKITATNTKPKKTTTTTKPKNTKPKNTGPSKAKGGSKISGPTKGLIAVGTTVPFLFGNKSKDSSTNTTNPKKDRDFRKRLQQDDAYSMDKMLDSKPVPKGPDRKREARPKQGGGFGTNISFASKDVKNLRENANMLKKQIDNLDITSMQKNRLKKVINTREKGYSMDESYRRAFNTVKKRVKDKTFNID